jgi:SOS-response transcriptional repressor LexA
MGTTIGQRLRAVREEAGFATAAEAARKFSWSGNTLRSAENDHRPPGRKAVIKYARAFGVNVDWLLTGRPPKRAGSPEPTREPSADTALRLRPVPLVREVSGQRASPNAEVQILMPHVGDLSPEAFAFELPEDDDAMVDPVGSPASLHPSDVVVVDPAKPPSPGSVVLVQDGKRRVVRRVRTISEGRDGQSDRVALIPSNPDYASMEVAADKIVGVVTGLYRRAR